MRGGAEPLRKHSVFIATWLTRQRYCSNGCPRASHVAWSASLRHDMRGAATSVRMTNTAANCLRGPAEAAFEVARKDVPEDDED